VVEIVTENPHHRTLMIWSKKLLLFHELLAPSLKPRLALRTAAYRADQAERGRTWFEYDGEEIVSFCDFVRENRLKELQGDDEAVIEQGVFSKMDFGHAFGQFLEMSIEDALASDNPLIVALAMLDRRLGKRRLKQLAGQSLAEPANTLLHLRMAAEGITS
jgi:hypothetical protein